MVPAASPIAIGTDLVTTDYRRQEELIKLEQLGFPLTLVGAGGIGSPTALALSKLGCDNITIYDPDRVEPHNLPNQLFGPADLGRYKVDALADLIDRLTGTRPNVMRQSLDEGPHSGVVVLAVDTMAARSAIWQASVRFQPSVSLFVDARMGGEVGRVIVVAPTDPDDIRFYETTLHDDDAATTEPCLVQSVGYSTLVIAGLVTSCVRRFAAGDRTPAEMIVDLATLSLLTRSNRGPLLG